MIEDGKLIEDTRSRLIYLAWRRYRIPRELAEDLVQNALATFLEIRDRYERVEEHPRVLTGVFRNKCREYIDASVREQKKIRELASSADARRELPVATPGGAAPGNGVLDQLVRGEEATIILEALAQLRPEAREMFELIIEDGASRKDLIERYGLNKNTLDSRLHVYRRELKSLLAQRGLHV